MGGPSSSAGKNWYECKAGCELILDDITELVFVVGTFGEKHKKKVIMGLPGLPERPNKTTRLSLALAYVSQKKCQPWQIQFLADPGTEIFIYNRRIHQIKIVVQKVAKLLQ